MEVFQSHDILTSSLELQLAGSLPLVLLPISDLLIYATFMFVADVKSFHLLETGSSGMRNVVEGMLANILSFVMTERR